jgi:hypothetical protein
MSHRARRWPVVPLVAVTVLTLADSSSSASGSSGSPSASPETSASTEVSGTVPDVGEPVASRSVTRSGNTYRLDVFPLAFDEGSPGVAVNLRLTFDKMSEPTVLPGMLASVEDLGSVRMRRASGLQVVDRAGGTAYLPARDSEGIPLCSPEVPNEAREGDTVYVTCVFGGLAEDAETLDLVVPSFGTFRDVAKG